MNSKLSHRKNTLCVRAWNIRTLMDNKNCERPERRTAHVGRELLRYSIDIAALSETRLADTGEVTKAGAGYTCFWSGKALNERREAGVGFAIRTALVKNLESLPRGISDRLMVMRIALHGKMHLTLISVYAPHHDLHSGGERVVLSEPLQSATGDAQSWPDVIGPHGSGHENTNGLLLLTLCAEHGLTITNTLFQLPDIHKTTWMHPRSKHWHLIDYVITRRRDIQDVHITRAMRGADCWTDHLLLRCKLSFSIVSRHRRQKADVKKKLDVQIQKLNEPNTKEALIINLANQLEHLPAEGDYEKAWANFRDEKKKAFTAWLNDKDSKAKHDRLKNIRGKVQTELRQMKDKCREGLWAILTKLCCPPKFVRIIQPSHDGMMARIVENGDVSDPFPVSNGVKQGCVMAPTTLQPHVHYHALLHPLQV
ncbi:craniofacial development protein 2-like [Diadema antillarum]|uniref:craniofacial development protein 2-like n=1 Tax=Diadema antillarum TaxID=105358 RepID=UPI003A842A18